MTILVDTNVLLRWATRQDPSVAATRALRRRGERLVISPQNAVEFWGVATRPVRSNGLGLTPGVASRLLGRIERRFPLEADTSAIHSEWRRLVAAHSVSGRQVHDARLAAVMNVHGIAQILTFNTADFARYPGITAIHPAAVGTTP